VYPQSPHDHAAPPGAEAEEAIDRVRSLAARLFGTSIARISFVDSERSWLNSGIGIEAVGMPLAGALCEHTLQSDHALVVPDAAADPRFASDPLVVGGQARFYAGAPLVSRDGHRLGTLAVIDSVPRFDVSAIDARHLEQLASMVVDELDLRAAKQQLLDELASRNLVEGRLKLLNELTEAALAAPNFKAAMRTCLERIAAHIAADSAFAFGMAPHAAMCEIEAEYVAPGLGDVRSLFDYLRNFPARRDNTIAGETMLKQQPVAISDLAAVDGRRFPLIRRMLQHGFCSLLSVPFENAGARFGLTFLFRRPPGDMARLTETVHGLSAKLRDLLVRKHAEEQIALLQSVVLHANDAVMIAEADARPGEPPRIVYVNRSFSALTGYPAEAVIGSAPPFLNRPHTDPAAIERLRTALARWEPVRVEMINHRADGSEFWAEIDVTPVADANGWYTHWIAILRDSTERKRAEEALKEREVALRQLAEQQAAILDALPAHVALLDREGSIVSVSRTWQDFAKQCRLDVRNPTGYSYFEFIKKNCTGRDINAVARGISAVLAGREAQFSMDHACDGDGQRRWSRLLMAPIAPGRAAGAVAMHLDITASKLAEEALRREKEFSEFLIKSSTEGILVFDRQLRITLWNPGIETITGLGADQVLGRNLLDALPGLASTTGEAAMRGTLEGRETSLFDQRYAISASGREGYYEAYFSPLYSRGQDIVGGIGFLRETTERRRIEDALRQSQKMEAVGQLTGGIAHDFNNMLTVIAGNLELLEGKLSSEPRLLRLVSAAALAASRAEKLTQQLLTFSRRQQLRPQPIDFNQIIIGMDDLLHRTVGEHIEIKKQLAPELWPALADPNQIETALLNLILNARDAVSSGGRITLETSNADVGPRHSDLAPGAYATLSVSDTGHGMSEDVLAHVFEPFFTTKEVGKGTGLGLAQVYGFIKQSSGHVKIESQVGKGTVVRLYLPRAEGAVGSAGIAPIREQQYRGTETVLVVEDDHGVRDFAVSVLRELGYRVLEAASGDTGLDVLDHHTDIDLLFTDVVMPGLLNGADLAKAALERRPDLHVLFTSGYTTRLVEKEWPARNVELLRKPYRSIDLAARVRSVLDSAERVAE
jgi:PAS domain S-box-containing protein